jgi:hypothetical protein
MTKYNFEITEGTFTANINRLTNQIWKLIPMKENSENWLGQLDTVLLEIVGLNEILNFDKRYLSLLSKLEGLKLQEDIEFGLYRKTVFEIISLLRELSKK